MGGRWSWGASGLADGASGRRARPGVRAALSMPLQVPCRSGENPTLGASNAVLGVSASRKLKLCKRGCVEWGVS
ncbi:hypothetical protein D3C87_1960000 [compost metagenome]